jgi:hypothetical protein
MRTMAAVLTAMLIISVVDTQAFVANPDRTYYQGAGSWGQGVLQLPPRP